MSRLPIPFAVAVLIGTAACMADEPPSTDSWIARFSAAWDDGAWEGGRRAYMWPLDDTAWQARMQALQGLAAAGQAAVDPLVEVLGSGEDIERILAAQALGYLPDVPREPLLKAAREDRVAAVRLYAVDALGMRGGADLSAELRELANQESNGDVKKHIGYALERQQTGVDPGVVRELVEWDIGRIDSAQLGQPAPDFTLTSLTGDELRLSQFRGQKAVVLVFVYGDT